MFNELLYKINGINPANGFIPSFLKKRKHESTSVPFHYRIPFLRYVKKFSKIIPYLKNLVYRPYENIISQHVRPLWWASLYSDRYYCYLSHDHRMLCVYH